MSAWTVVVAVGAGTVALKALGPALWAGAPCRSASTP